MLWGVWGGQQQWKLGYSLQTGQVTAEGLGGRGVHSSCFSVCLQREKKEGMFDCRDFFSFSKSIEDTRN